jgi:L-gulonate 5-dehydrogenase
MRITDAPKPRPGPGEALVRVKAAGLCAGDLYIYTGKNPYVSYPRIGCHEIVGEVAAYGEGASGPAVGARVCVDPFIGCGKCYPCRIGKRNCCANLSIVGVHRDGGFADFLTAPAKNLIPVPVTLSDFEAVFAEPVAIGVQGCNRGMVTGDDIVLVLGAGPIGLAVLEVARARGATVYITDLDAGRLAIGEQLGGIPIGSVGSCHGHHPW